MIKIIKTTKKMTDIIDTIEENEMEYTEKIIKLKNSLLLDNINELYGNMKSLEIIQVEYDIIKLVSKYSLQNNILEYTFIISCLKYLFKLSEILRIRLKQPVINISKNNKNGIIRCSYKFCSFKDSCVYNYSKKGNLCYQDHYVHNMISHDITALILFIESTTDISIYNKDILKSINTLSFVIGHMETELRTKCMYADIKDWESFHYIHNIKS
jgi:hypothetical protein